MVALRVEAGVEGTNKPPSIQQASGYLAGLTWASCTSLHHSENFRNGGGEGHCSPSTIPSARRARAGMVFTHRQEELAVGLEGVGGRGGAEQGGSTATHHSEFKISSWAEKGGNLVGGVGGKCCSGGWGAAQ